MKVEGRFSEWYVPKRGPLWFRTLAGLSFYPYSIMCACFPVMAGLFAPVVHWDREIAIFVAYLLGLGIAAHALDAMGEGRPWGQYLSKKQLWSLVISGFAASLAIGVYYTIVIHTMVLATGLIAIFFALAYNLEWFKGRLHTNGAFALTWGSWSMLVGYTFSGGYNILILFLLMVVGYSAASVEINASRPYRSLKKQQQVITEVLIQQYQLILISVVLLVLSLTALLIASK